MKKFLTLFFMLTLLFTAFSQQSNCPPTIEHLGVTYNTVFVGGNCWMRENLRAPQYGVQSNIDIVYPGLQPTYVTYPGADPFMGYLYTWYSAVGLPQGSTANPPTAISERVQGICPDGWAIPSATQLEALLASGETRSETQTYWAFNTGTIPSGPYVFLMVPSGFYNNKFNQFAEYNHAGYLWTLTYTGNKATCGIFPFDCRQPASMSMNKNSLLSVRCVQAPPYGVEVITACDSITWNGVTRYNSGRYVANLPNDSVSTLVLTVNRTTYETVKLVACDSYYWNLTEETYTTSGVHQATIENYLGCDSVVTLDLEVRYSNTGIDVQNHCDSYTWIDGHTYTESTNTPTFVVTNAAGCDSTVTLNLTIRKMTTGIDVQDHCDSYTWIDGNTYTESTNTPTFTLTNAAGCDSVVTLNLTIRNKTYGIDVQDHCDSYTWINGITYTESTNEPVYTITNAAGCDSIVTLNLTIRKSTSSPSQSYEAINTYTWNGQTYTTSGVYTATLTNAVGCDSTATLDLTVFYQFPITYNVNGGVMPAEYPINYIQGVGATLPIPTKAQNRFDGWYDNATFTGSPITAVSNSESGDKQYYALWTVLTTGINSSLSFSGSSSAYARIPDAPALNITNTITLEAWIYPTAWGSSTTTGTIISKEGNNRGYVLRTGSSGRLSFAFGTTALFQEIATVSPHPLVLNQWQHIAATYDGTTMKLYRNGVEVATKAQTGAMALSTNPLEIGRSPQSTTRYFTGRIDEARVFNVALNAATIQSWYNKTINNTHGNYANLVGYYECDSTANATAITGTVGSAGIVASATYVTNCVSPFISNSSVITAPSSVTAIHPIPQYNTVMYPVVPGDTLAQILRIDVKSTLGGNLSQVVVSTNGSTNPSDISRARLWYTGTSTTFSTATPFGTPVLNPNGTITFTGSQAISCGSTYYLWLTYDINPSATYGNVVDAELVNCTVERLVIPSTVSAPVGNRPIVNPCTFHILQIRDTWGDTWQGTYISVLKNNDTIFSNISVLEGPGTDRYQYQHWYDFPFVANSGDTIRIVKTIAVTSGAGECKFKIMLGSTAIANETTVADANTIVAGCFNTVTATAGANGIITPSGSFNVYGNRTQTFTVTPNQFYFIDSLIINGINDPTAISTGSYTFSNLTSPQTIRATFASNYVTPTLTTAPTSSSIYEGSAISTSTLTGGLVQYNGTDVEGVFNWTTPTQIATTSGLVDFSVTFTPNPSSTYFPISFTIPVNVLPSSVLVANGTTTNSYIPVYGTWLDADQINYIIYPDTMLTALIGKQITSLTFYSSTASQPWTSVATVKMGQTSLTELTTSTVVPSPATTVFQGTLVLSGNQMVWNFSTPYTYMGGNLLIEVSTIAGEDYYAYFYGVVRTATSRRTYNITNTAVQNFVPKTKFSYLP